MKQKDTLHEAANLVISDEEFSQALHTVAKFVKDFFDTKHTPGMEAVLHVFTKHSIKEKLEHTMIPLPGFPPPIGALISRYDLLELAGAKYFTEMVQQKPVGEKCYPLAVFIHSEAWIRMEKATKPAKNFTEAREEAKKLKSFAETENKQEIYISAGMTLDNRNNLAFLPIDRLPTGEIMMKAPQFHEYTKEKVTGSDLLLSFYRGFTRALRKEYTK